VDEAFSTMAKDIVEKLKTDPSYFGSDGASTLSLKKEGASGKQQGSKGGCC